MSENNEGVSERAKGGVAKSKNILPHFFGTFFPTQKCSHFTHPKNRHSRLGFLFILFIYIKTLNFTRDYRIRLIGISNIPKAFLTD